MKVISYNMTFDEIHKGDDYLSRKFKDGPLNGYTIKTFEGDIWPPHFHLEDPNGNIVCAISMHEAVYLENHVKTIKILNNEEKLQIINKLKERTSIYLEEDLILWRSMYYTAVNFTEYYSNIRVYKYLELPDMPDYMRLPSRNNG